MAFCYQDPIPDDQGEQAITAEKPLAVNVVQFPYRLSQELA